MKKPNLHPRENERLKALDSLNILDTSIESDFDEITLIASQICATPIALISIIDDTRQWFKSKVGVTKSETSKDIAFCAHAILQDEVFVIPDTSKDERFFDNPLVTGDLQVKFYAGAPVLDPSTNLPIGTLCVVDNKPRTLETSQIAALKALSKQVSRLLLLRGKVNSLMTANEKLIFQKIAFDNISEAIILTDRSGKIVDYNRAVLEVLGLTLQELNSLAILDPEWQSTKEDGSLLSRDEHPVTMSLTTARPQKDIVMGIETKNSEKRWILINSIPLFLADETNPSHVVSTFSNITKQVMAQKAMIQSAKMTSLGEMAGGVAHEINTPLAIILSVTDQVLSCLNSEPIEIENAIKKIKKIESTAGRISEIVKGMRTFSRNSADDQHQIVSIKEVVLDTLSLCCEKFKANQVDIENHVTDDVFAACISTQVSQVLLNVLINAFDAVSEQKEKWIRLQLESDSNRIRLRVIDSGNGIAESAVSKLMQPFYTTKPVGKGTGLGLSISKGIIESFKGCIYYEKYGKNTSFVIELPVYVMKKKDKSG